MSSSLTCAVSNSLTEDWELETAVHATNAIVAVAGADGELSLFSLSSISKEVVVFRRDPNSDTGWSQTNTGITSKAIARWDRPDETQSAIGCTDQLFEIFFDQTSGKYTTKSFGTTGTSFEASNLFSTAAYPDVPCVFYAKGPPGPLWMWRSVNPEAPQMCFTCYLDLNMPSTEPVYSKLVTICASSQRFPTLEDVGFVFVDEDSEDSAAWFAKVDGPLDLNGTSTQTSALPLTDVKDISFVLDPSGSAKVYYLLSDGTLGTCYQTGTDESGMPTWSVPMTMVSNEATAPIVSVTPAQRADGSVELFIITSNSKLWHVDVQGEGGGEWAEAVDLGLSAAQITTNIDDNGTVEAFIVTPTDTLVHLYQDSDGAWLQKRIEIDLTKNTPVRVNVYKSDFVLYDSQNLPVMAQTVKISSNIPMGARINNQAYVLSGSSNTPTTVQTSYDGRISISAEVEDFASPELTFDSASLPEPITARADDKTHGYLRNITVEQLEDANDPLTGEYVIPEDKRNKQDLANIANAISQSMSIADALFEPDPSIDAFMHESSDRRGVRGTSSSLPNSPANQAWSFSMVSGSPEFEWVADDDFEGLLLASDTDIFDDIGSFFESAWNGVVEIVKLSVKVTEEAIEAVFQLAEGIVSFVVSTLWSAFEFCRVVFDMIGAIQGTIIGWLLSVVGFVFDWDGIRANRDSLKKQIKDSAVQVTSLFPDPDSWEGKINSMIEQVRTDIDSVIEELKASLGGDSMNTFRDNKNLNNIFSTPGGKSFQGPATSMLQRGLHSMSTSGPPVADATALPLPFPGFDDLINALETAVQNVEEDILNLIEELSDKFANIFADPTSLIENSVFGLLDVIESLLDAGLDIAEDLVPVFVTIAKAALENLDDIVAWFDNAALLDIPYFAALYKGVTQSTLTPLDFICLAAAIPITILNDLMAPRVGELNIIDFAITVVFFIWGASNGGAEINKPLAGAHAVQEESYKLLKRMTSASLLINSVLICISSLEKQVSDPAKSHWAGYFLGGWSGVKALLIILQLEIKNTKCLALFKVILGIVSEGFVWGVGWGLIKPRQQLIKFIPATVGGVSTLVTAVSVAELCQESPKRNITFGALQFALGITVAATYQAANPLVPEAVDEKESHPVVSRNQHH